MKISILIPKYCEPASVTALLEIFDKTDICYQIQTGAPPEKPLFSIELIGETEQVLTAHGLEIKCHNITSKVNVPDLVIVPAMGIDIANNLEANKNLVPFLRRMHSKGSAICSICTGAFLVGSAQLDNQAKMTTHWYFESTFKKMFPNIPFESERIIVDEHNIMSSGGTTSVYNMGVYIVQKYISEHLANGLARVMLIDKDKMTQNPYRLFEGTKDHEDEVILRIQNLIEENYQLSFNIKDLSQQFAISERSLNRRFKRATAMTPIQYLQQTRIKIAKELLGNSVSSINNIAERVGYSDPTAFRRIFKRIVSITPSAYRVKYRA